MLWFLELPELGDKQLRDHHTTWHKLQRKLRAFDSGNIMPPDEYAELMQPCHRLAFFQQHALMLSEFQIRGEHPACHVQIPADLYMAKESRIVPVYGQEPYEIPEDVIEAQRWKLVCEWQGAFRGRQVARENIHFWQYYIQEYQKHGCTHVPDVLGRCRICGHFFMDQNLTWHPLTSGS